MQGPNGPQNPQLEPKGLEPLEPKDNGDDHDGDGDTHTHTPTCSCFSLKAKNLLGQANTPPRRRGEQIRRRGQAYAAAGRHIKPPSNAPPSQEPTQRTERTLPRCPRACPQHASSPRLPPSGPCGDNAQAHGASGTQTIAMPGAGLQTGRPARADQESSPSAPGSSTRSSGLMAASMKRYPM